MKTQIGWYHLKEDKVFHDNGYECAAWYENISVKAGKYPIEVYDLYVGSDGKVHGHIDCGYVTMDGIIVSDYFGSMFCGVPVGTYDSTKNAGKKSYYHMSSYLFSIANAILEGSNEWELFPEYEAKEIHFTYEGKQYISHGIFKIA